ncbi:kinase-like protein [Rhizophagus irregularis]|nr:kinase-like protein [Rhizophagus irregularis]
MTLIILKELLEAIIFNKGWKLVLVAFFIAFLDSCAWVYTEDTNNTRFDLIVIVIGLSYILYTEADRMRLSRQEFQWVILRFCDKKPHQAYSCIFLFILSILYYNIYVSSIILIILFTFLSDFAPNNLLGISEFGSKIFKIVHYIIPPIIMVILFKLFLAILMTSKSTLEILSSVIYEELMFYLMGFAIPFLLIFSTVNYQMFVNHYNKNLSLYTYFLFSLKMQKLYWLVVFEVLSILPPICIHCGHTRSERNWCQNCAKKYFINNISKWTSGHEVIDNLIKEFQFKAKNEFECIEWIPFNEFDIIKEIGKGGFGTVYSATWKSGPLTMLNGNFGRINRSGQQKVAIKTLGRSDNITKEFLHELEAHIKCATTYSSDFFAVLRCYGLSQDPVSGSYMIVMDLVENGSLNQYLQKKFSTLKWNEDKLRLLVEISSGLKVVHEVDLVHHDFHTGNILIGKEGTAYLADLGLSRPANIQSSKSDAFGVLPFVAPEVLRGNSYTKASDIYSFGMIMWAVSSGQNPFSRYELNSDLALRIVTECVRPPIIKGIPKIYVDLMVKCWDPDPLKRPSAADLEKTFRKWYFNGEFYDKFAQADKLSVDYITNIIQRSQPISSYKSHKSSICRPLDYDVSNVLDSTQLGLVIDNEMQGSKQLNEINLELALDNKTSENQESQFIHSYSKFVSNKFIEEAEKNNESKKSKQFDKTNFELGLVLNNKISENKKTNQLNKMNPESEKFDEINFKSSELELVLNDETESSELELVLNNETENNKKTNPLNKINSELKKFDEINFGKNIF